MNPYGQGPGIYPSQQYQYAPQSQQYYQQPQFNIQAMYSGVQPYNNQEFLLSVFGNKIEYIKVFLTLSHEDKLMLYMLTEERKMYGEIRDKQNYQRLLKEIAQKVHNYNLYYHGDKKQESKGENKEKDLENRIDDFVERTFEKFQLTANSIQQKKIEQLKDQPEVEVQQQQEWVESIQEPYPELKQSKSAIERRERQLSEQKENLRNGAGMNKMTTLDPYYNYNISNQFGVSQSNQKKSIWDLDLQQDQLSQREPNLREIFQSSTSSHVTVQQMDNLDEEDDFEGNNTADPNGYEFRYSHEPGQTLNFHSKNRNINKSSTMDPNINALTSSDHGHNPFRRENNRLFGEHGSQSAKLIFSPSYGVNYEKKQELSNEAVVTEDKAEQIDSSGNDTNNSEYKQWHQSPEQNYGAVFGQVKEVSNEDGKQQEMVHFEGAQVGVSNNNIGGSGFGNQLQTFATKDNKQDQTGPQKPTSLLKPHEINYTSEFESLFTSQSSSKSPEMGVDYNMDLFDAFGVSPTLPKQSMPQDVVKLEEIQDKVEDEDDFDSYEQAGPAIEQPRNQTSQEERADFIQNINKLVDVPNFEKKSENGTNPPNNIQQHELHYSPQPDSNLMQVEVPRKEDNNSQLISQPLMTYSDPINYAILSQLKIEMNSDDKHYVETQLRSRSYQCDISFYHKIMEYLRDLNLTSSPEFQHFNQQYILAKKLHEETAKYTAAVDEDEEQLVFSSIKITKALMNQIYQGSPQTEKYAATLISKDSRQKGFLFKFEKVLVDMGIKNEILTKVIGVGNLTQTENSFYAIYTLDKLNTLQGLQHHTERIMAFTNKQYERFKFLDQEILGELEEDPERYPKYMEFIKGFVKLLCICQRMVAVLKACGMKSQTNMVKTLKICKDVKAKYASYRDPDPQGLLPDRYKEVLRESIAQNKSLYDMHSQFIKVCEEVPVCSMCLLPIGSGGQRFENERHCHYSCFNLLVQLEKRSSE